MYGRSNPVLRHFSADEIATLGSLQVLDDLREQGGRVPTLEELNPRPIPSYEDYFEFDRPMTSGIAVTGSRDLLVEEATMGFHSSDLAPGMASVPLDSGSSAPSDLRVTFTPPPPGSSSAHEVAYHRRGLVISASLLASRSSELASLSRHGPHAASQGRPSSGHNSRTGSPAPYTRTDRSSESQAAVTPRRSYDDRPSLKQPPFRAGNPTTATRRPATAGASRRTVSTSPGTSRSPSPRPSHQPPSSEAGTSSEPRTQPDGATGTTGSGSIAAVRGIGAKISGRPASARVERERRGEHPGGDAGGTGGPGAAAGAPRPVSASPRTPRGGQPQDSRSSGDQGDGAGAGGRGRAAGRQAGPVPAWSPAAGVENMRLQDDPSEAARVAHLLNDPRVSPAATNEDAPSTESSPFERTPLQLAEQILGGSPRPGSPGAQSSSPGFDRQARASMVSDRYFDQYRLRKHREAQGVPDYRYSQPRSHGAHVPVQPRNFSFDEAHPALAQEHYVRSPAQDAMLQAERRKMHQQLIGAARAAAKNRITMPASGGAGTPTAASQQLSGDVERIVRVREAGRARLRQLEEEGETLRLQTVQIQQRARDAIARSTQITAATGLRSRPTSAAASPYSRRGTRSRSTSPMSYNGGFGASGTMYYSSRSPSPSPSRFRPHSASPVNGSLGADRSGVAAGDAAGGGRFNYEGSSYYGSPPRQHYDQNYDHHHYQQQHQQQWQEEGGYYGVGSERPAAGWAASQRPLSAPPPRQQPVSPGPGPGEALQILDVIDEVEGYPQGTSERAATRQGQRRTPSRRDTDSSGQEDPLARAGRVLSSRKHAGVMDEQEQRIATGVYDESRYEEYQRQVDLEMQRRAVEDGYDSDLERDEAAGLLVRDHEQEAEEEEEERKRAREFSWQEEDEWMDEYRQRFGPEDGYMPSRSVSAREGPGSEDEIDGEPHAHQHHHHHDHPHQGRAHLGRHQAGPAYQHRHHHQPHGGGSPGTSSPLRPQRSALSEADEELLQQHFVPLISPEISMNAAGYASEGPETRRSRRRLFFKSTVPQPFTFEEREKARPKRISKVKMEQDMAIRRAEEAAARSRHFKASPVPDAVVEPRYEHMLVKAEVKRQLSHQQHMDSVLGQPFSFYYRDQEMQAEREALARAAKDPNRFRMPFQARDVPSHTKEEKFRVMMLELEARREYSKRRIEEARRAARERVEREAERRREVAKRAYQERLRTVDPAVHQGPHPSRPAGVVPDFNTMHRQFEVQMAQARANIRKMVTAPREFRLNGGTQEEQAARARKAEERRRRIILDMQVDAELLPESRWPFKSPRGKVRRNPPPAYLVEWMTRTQGTHAASARKSSTAAAAQGGAYQTRAEREAADRKASEKLRAEALRRADRLLKAAQERKQREAASAGVGGGEFGIQSDVVATAGAGPDQGSTSSGRGGAQRRRAAVAGRQDNPEVYVDARHAQIERRVRSVVEDALLDQGIEAYRYVEGIDANKKGNKTSN
ncbi:hypothetical protein Agub_g8083 [Astrephomene gubernaculifera]|uniref:Uncharacterized protein n=1 Tax=Astrephomene gubernaculifera TaxID=47775 RepID=A0AAD3HMV0_9CHLO|nr:hypothetical protein Agub_g8083 [Astrephomene gubernaculifera]